MISVRIMWLGMSLQEIRPFFMHKPDCGFTCWQKSRQALWAAACCCCSSAELVVVEYGDLLGNPWESGK